MEPRRDGRVSGAEDGEEKEEESEGGEGQWRRSSRDWAGVGEQALPEDEAHISELELVE